MIRKAKKEDITVIAETYRELLTYEQQFWNNSNWKLDVYPTVAVPKDKVPTGTMYVLEENGEICASMVLNHEQSEEYKEIDWKYLADAENILVIHTLCIPPRKAGLGYGQILLRGLIKEEQVYLECIL